MYYLFFILCHLLYLLFFFFNDTATTEIYTLSLHDAIQVDARVRWVTLGPEIENLERLIGHLQAVVDIGQQSQPSQVQMLKCFVLNRGQCFLGRGRLPELLEHVGLKNSIMKLLRRQVDRFPDFGGSIAHSPGLSQGHAAIEIGPCVLWGT